MEAHGSCWSNQLRRSRQSQFLSQRQSISLPNRQGTSLPNAHHASSHYPNLTLVQLMAPKTNIADATDIPAREHIEVLPKLAEAIAPAAMRRVDAPYANVSVTCPDNIASTDGLGQRRTSASTRRSCSFLGHQPQTRSCRSCFSRFRAHLQVPRLLMYAAGLHVAEQTCMLQPLLCPRPLTPQTDSRHWGSEGKV